MSEVIEPKADVFKEVQFLAACIQAEFRGEGHIPDADMLDRYCDELDAAIEALSS